MVRVLYIVSTLKRSGPTNVLFNLIAELDRDKFEPIILTLSPEETKAPSSKDIFLKIGVKIHSLHLSRLQGFLYAKKKMREFVNDHNIGIIHLMGFRGDLLINHRDFKRVKIISTINSNIYDDYTMLYGKIKGTIMSYLHIRSLKGKTGIACSQFVAHKLHDRYNISLKVIYNGIPKNEYNITSAGEAIPIAKQLNLDVTKKIFIFIGSLIYRKDPITIIKAFLNSKRIDDCHLLLIGDGPLMAECKDLCRDHMDKVTFFGNQPETLKFLKAANYYVASSLSEGLPTSVMEAMGCGLPVILSDIDPHKELLNHLNGWPYTFAVSRPDILTEKIDDILDDDYKNLSIGCRKVIDDYINSEIMAQNYQRLYEE